MFCGAVGLILMLIMFSPKPAMALFPKFWSRFIFFVFGVKLDIRNIQNTNKREASIYAANHASPLDIPAMFLSLPVPGYFISKMELKKIPLMGWYMTISGMIFIDRKNREKAMESMRKAGEQIKKGKNVIVYPEGTRSKTGVMQQFKRGSFIMAKESLLPIQPCAISGAYARMKSGDLICKPGTIVVDFLPRTKWDDQRYSSPEDFANKTQIQVSQALIS